MIDKYLKIETLSIVLLGDFNPVIFQPYWLANKELIREDEAKNAKIDIIHNDIVRYEIADWFNVEINKGRCEFKTTKTPYFDPIKDLTISIFSILKETPIKSMGINHVYDLSLLSNDNFYKFGNTLTPLSIWGDSINDPRLLHLEIYEKERKDIVGASRRIRITPSDQTAIAFGITVNINNHFQLENKGNSNNLFSMIENNWKKSFSESKNIVEELFSKIDF